MKTFRTYPTSPWPTTLRLESKELTLTGSDVKMSSSSSTLSKESFITWSYPSSSNIRSWARRSSATRWSRRSSLKIWKRGSSAGFPQLTGTIYGVSRLILRSIWGYPSIMRGIRVIWGCRRKRTWISMRRSSAMWLGLTLSRRSQSRQRIRSLWKICWEPMRIMTRI